MIHEILNNFAHNLFKPLLLFFYAGFLIPILKVKFDFPKQAYQALTIFLLVGIGWHGGEELAKLDRSMYGQAISLMILGFFTNLVIGFVSYFSLKYLVRIRQIDSATIAGYYGSDSAGTFVTATAFVTVAAIPYASYMPVMLAIMEIPGCIVALYLVANMRRNGMDVNGNMPNEPGYSTTSTSISRHVGKSMDQVEDIEADELAVTVGASEVESDLDIAVGKSAKMESGYIMKSEHSVLSDGAGYSNVSPRLSSRDSSGLTTVSFDPKANDSSGRDLSNGHELKESRRSGHSIKQLLHEVFLNSGIYLLFAGITIGLIGRLQGENVVAANNRLFNDLFPPLLCLFLLEMGITASKKLRDLKQAGWKLVAFGLIAPNVFATFGMLMMLLLSIVSGRPFDLGTYVLFAVLCGAASYIALPAVQQMAIPEASPTLPLAASLGVTFTYNVTIGITMYMVIAQALIRFGPSLPVAPGI